MAIVLPVLAVVASSVIPCAAWIPPLPITSGLVAASRTAPAVDLTGSVVVSPPAARISMLPGVVTSPRVNGWELVNTRPPLLCMIDRAARLLDIVPPLLLKLPVMLSAPFPVNVPPVMVALLTVEAPFKVRVPFDSVN